MERTAVHSSRLYDAMQQPGQATVGIVLAGGGSTRLASVAATGGGKALLTFHGQTFLEHVVAAVAAEMGPTIVVASPGQRLPALDGVRVVHDLTPGAGPLAGIRDGLRAVLAVDDADHADHAAAQPPRLAFVASCDVPLVRREVVRLLVAVAAESDALWTVPVVHGHRQVLVSVMRVELLSRIDAWLSTGRRDLRGLFNEMAQTDPQSVGEVTEEACKAVDPTLESFVDIDTPDDLERLQSR
jgi:molybdopterin-guanine dinucleotide biosynthesis protein A